MIVAEMCLVAVLQGNLRLSYTSHANENQSSGICLRTRMSKAKNIADLG